MFDHEAQEGDWAGVPATICAATQLCMPDVDLAIFTSLAPKHNLDEYCL